MTRKLIVYACLCAFGAPAFAQPATSPAPGATQAEPASRGLFLIALMPVLAGMVGKTGDNLIEAMFRPRPPAPPKAEEPKPAATKPEVKAEQLAKDGTYYAGVAYATFIVEPNGEAKRIDPSTHQFRTGDQFFVRYVPNLPGRVDVSNINPRGQEVPLGSWPVAAGQEVTLPAQGTFQFDGAAGDEGLRIAFTPCTSGAGTRDITINASASVNYGALLPACGGAQKNATRDIAVSFENGIGYGVSPLDRGEVQTRAVETRSLVVQFRHAPVARDAAALGDWLVTPEESAQAVSRAVTPIVNDPEGPTINVREPGVVKEVKPPVTIDVVFEPKEGKSIDFNTLKITYLKLFGIDITDRMKPYITPTGLHSANAKLPPGDHNIEIAVQDTEGKKTTQRFSFKVLK